MLASRTKFLLPTFYVFFQSHFKKRKKSRFLTSEKNEKYVFSNTGLWLSNDPTAKVSERVNRKCPHRSKSVQLSWPWALKLTSPKFPTQYDRLSEQQLGFLLVNSEALLLCFLTTLLGFSGQHQGLYRATFRTGGRKSHICGQGETTRCLICKLTVFNLAPRRGL